MAAFFSLKSGMSCCEEKVFNLKVFNPKKFSHLKKYIEKIQISKYIEKIQIYRKMAAFFSLRGGGRVRLIGQKNSIDHLTALTP